MSETTLAAEEVHLMIASAVEAALNEQLNLEFFSSYSYLAMAAYCDRLNLKGMSKWLEIQSQEEHTHALKFFHFLLQRSAAVEMKPIAAAPTQFRSVQEVFEMAYANEEHVTHAIDALVSLSLKHDDHATNTFLQWFVSEQVEELALVDEVLQSVKLVGDNGGALFILDRELGRRTGEPAAADESV